MNNKFTEDKQVALLGGSITQDAGQTVTGRPFGGTSGYNLVGPDHKPKAQVYGRRVPPPRQNSLESTSQQKAVLALTAFETACEAVRMGQAREGTEATTRKIRDLPMVCAWVPTTVGNGVSAGNSPVSWSPEARADDRLRGGSRGKILGVFWQAWTAKGQAWTAKVQAWTAKVVRTACGAGAGRRMPKLDIDMVVQEVGGVIHIGFERCWAFNLVLNFLKNTLKPAAWIATLTECATSIRDPCIGNPAIPRVMANRSPDRLKPNMPDGKTLGNLRPFPAK
ncbi:hypothetical protein C8J57DRAFT_1246637 [Mycena rebaudengoi]|nr:hypothetical protein C8J57DRAFT_1246637 [Mycena rebaudengoi]